MKQERVENFKRGWVVGDFLPTLHKANLEVGIHSYPSGTVHQAHFHKKASEINVITSGQCRFTFISPDERTIDMVSGDILIVEPYETVEFKATTDCSLTVIKTDSIPNDKYNV